MHLEKLILTHFKNYTSQAFHFSSKLNCLVGLNGMGKTNVLDSIYYLCMTKSHFVSSDANVMQHEADFFRLEGHFSKEKKPLKIVAKVLPRKKKEIEKNGVSYQKFSDHIGLFPVVFIAPDDTFIALEGSETRRRFLDNTLSQISPHYLQQLIQYNKIIKQRNAALKQMGESQQFDPSLINIYNNQLLQPGTFIFEERSAFSKKFTPILVETYKYISGKQEDINCTYESTLKEKSLADLLLESQEKDRILQRTTVGIHKDDLNFSINNRALKKFASQGQLKSFILALKLAQYEILKAEKKVLPILLLDDIFDKLDSRRVGHLLELLLQGDFGQIFITDTHEDRIERIIQPFESDYRKFTIESGAIKNNT